MCPRNVYVGLSQKPLEYAPGTAKGSQNLVFSVHHHVIHCMVDVAFGYGTVTITIVVIRGQERLTDVDRLVQCRNFCPFDFVTVSRTSFKDRAQRVHRNVLLILGCCNAGKTQLFYRVRR